MNIVSIFFNNFFQKLSVLLFKSYQYKKWIWIWNFDLSRVTLSILCCYDYDNNTYSHVILYIPAKNNAKESLDCTAQKSKNLTRGLLIKFIKLVHLIYNIILPFKWISILHPYILLTIDRKWLFGSDGMEWVNTCVQIFFDTISYITHLIHFSHYIFLRSLFVFNIFYFIFLFDWILFPTVFQRS